VKPPFRIRYTGDDLDETVGVGDIALAPYDGVPFVDVDFLRDQAPAPGDYGYRVRLYSLEIPVPCRRRMLRAAQGNVPDNVVKPEVPDRFAQEAAFAHVAER
jgi:hypothetical protein